MDRTDRTCSGRLIGPVATVALESPKRSMIPLAAGGLFPTPRDRLSGTCRPAASTALLSKRREAVTQREER